MTCHGTNTDTVHAADFCSLICSGATDPRTTELWLLAQRMASEKARTPNGKDFRPGLQHTRSLGKVWPPWAAAVKLGVL